MRLGLAVLGAGTMFTAAPVAAQTTGAFTERPQAALSRNLRSLAANPKSVTALMGAGKAALDLGDPQAALTFFARAEEQTPRDGRVKMWIATALVQLQQPHAALKFFRDATDLGVPAAEIARDRGLAHDIAGNPRAAQSDYRLALQKGRDDEATRRLALSMAITGEREPALRLLEDQLLVRDRAAERARAMILALTGDSAGAARAVQSAMPGPQAGAMSPFLARLPSLSPAERALAVHLGVFPQGAGRTAPSTAYAVNNFADAVTNAGRPDPNQGSLARRSSEPASTASGATRADEGGLAPAVRRTTRLNPVARAAPPEAPARSAPQEALAGVRQRSTTSRPSASPGFGGGSSHWALARGYDLAPTRRKPETPAKPPEAARTPARTRAETSIAAAPIPAPAFSLAPSTSTPAPTPAPAPTSTSVASAPATTPPAVAQPSVTEVRVAAVEPSAPVAQPLQQPSQAQPQPTTQSQPAEVRAVASAEPPFTQPRPKPQPAEVAVAAIEPSAPQPQSEGTPSGSRLADLSATLAEVVEPERPTERAAVAKPKPSATATAAKKPKPEAPAEPSRAWVQIAVGAAKTGLPREFARLKAKAPKLLAARGAWTAPLNATNRLLVGPFPNNREAQAFVNQLKAEDLDGFAWTSPAGQKVEKLPAK